MCMLIQWHPLKRVKWPANINIVGTMNARRVYFSYANE